MDLYIMRHGETLWNKNGIIQGSSDVELSEYGVELARITAEGLMRDGITFDRIYTSPLKRALNTAGIIAEYTAGPGFSDKIFTDDRLREMSFGKYEGQRLRDIGKTDSNIYYCFHDAAHYVPDDTGESYEHVFERINDFLYGELLPLESVPEIKSVLVICHGVVVRAFLKEITGITLDDFWNMKQPNCCINRILLKDGKFSLVSENILYYEPDDPAKRGIL